MISAIFNLCSERLTVVNNYIIKQINLDEYPNCNAIWNMQTCPYTDMFIEQIKAGSRDVFILSVDDEYIAGCDLVYENPEYGTIPGVRLYLSHLIVKRDERGKGYGEALSRYLLDKAKEKGYKSVALGVDCNNTAAVNLYKKLGFNIYEEAEDKDGMFYRMEKNL
jgi:ribosomal protein S18 acetylase RimI-like enzyme